MSFSKDKTFGELLGQFRTEANLTQQRLADMMHKARGTIINWENGTHLPKERTLVLELANHLHLDSLKRDQLLEAALLDSLGTVWTIPFQRNPFFTGREDILDYLHKALSTNKTIALMQPQALKGLGGIGKTHTSIEYAYCYRDEYQTILWAPAMTSSILQASLVSIATTLNLPEKSESDQDLVVKAVKQWLMRHSDWLLILDNVEDIESIGSLYPWAHNGHVIITTRSQSVGGIALSISLKKMEPEEGALFLLRRAALIGSKEGKEQAQGTDYEKAKELSEILDGLPLALDQAAAYIEKTRCGLSAYRELYRSQKIKLLSERGSLTTDHPESVTITFSLSFQKIETTSPVARELLQFCAFLSPDAIPEEIITHGGAYLGSTLETITTDLVEFNTAIGILLAYSLVQRDTDIGTGTQILSIHRLVQAVLQDMVEETKKHIWLQRAMLAVNAVFPHIEPNAELSIWPQCERLLPHALLAAQYIEKGQIISEEAARLLFETARYLYDRARYAEAELLYQRALRILEQQWGLEHPQMAQPLYGLANLYSDQGKYAEAELLYQRALRILEQQWGLEHPQVTQPLNGLATLYHGQGKYAEAELLYQRALRILEQQWGPEHLRVAQLLNNLAELYREQGKYAEAEPLFQRALHIRKQQLGPEHPNVASLLNNLASLYYGQGKYAEAELLYQRALRILEQQWGPEHPNVAFPLNNLANLYREQGKYAEAEPLFQRALHILEPQLGAEHLRVAYLLNNLASLYYGQSKYAEAELLFQQALHILEPEHPEMAGSLNGLANIYKDQGKYLEAEQLFQKTLHIREQQLGAEHPDTAETLHDLATFQQVQGNHEEALSLYQRAFNIRKQVHGLEHPKTKATYQHLTALRQLASPGIDTQGDSLLE